MKIGILTQPLHNNYGGLLQNYALQQVLKKKGYNVITIDHGIRKVPTWYGFLYHCKERFLHWLKPSKYPASSYNPSIEEKKIIGKNTRYFIDKYIDCTEAFYTYNELNQIIKESTFDAYIVGSDQCWRPLYSGGFLDVMYLCFAQNDNVKRLAYAASFGVDKWEYTPQETILCANLVKKFDIVTVREDSAVKLCKDYLDIEATLVLDPTMLLNKEDYEKIVEEEKEPVSTGDLFCYILNPNSEKECFIDRVSQRYGVVQFSILPKYRFENLSRRIVKHDIDDCIYPSVTSWLRGFMDAKMTIVDSFHGLVFSIIFNKPFWVLENSHRGNARFNSLLKLFNLEDRLVSINNINKVSLNSQIDWDNVNKTLGDMRQQSINVFDSLQ